MPETARLLHPVPGNQSLSFPGSAGVLFGAPGKIAPGFAVDEINNSVELLHYAHSWVHTTGPDGNPRIYFAANFKVYRIDNGSLTVDTTFADRIQNLAIIDNGSGTAVLVATFGQGITPVTNAHAYRSLITDTTPWTTVAEGAANLTAWGMVQIGPMVAAVTGSAGIGRATFGDAQVSFLPEGAAFGTAANWSVGFPCGTGKWPITKLYPFREFPVAITGDGLYAWDRVAKQFRNHMENVKDFRSHAVNGKGGCVGENGIWYPTAHRKLFFFDGYDVRDETPFREIENPRDVWNGRITAMADSGDTVRAAIRPWDRRLLGYHAGQHVGLRVWKVTNAGVITELTTDVTDGSNATPSSANMNGWGGAGGAGTWFLVVGSEVPLEGVALYVTRYANEAVQSFGSPQCSDGAGGWTSLGTVVDDTILGVAGISMALTGMPPGFAEPYLGWTDPDAYVKSKRDTFNGVSGLFFYRWTNVTGTAMANNDAQGPTIDEVGPILGRPGLPNKGVLTQSINHTPRLFSGGLAGLIEGKRLGGRIDWATIGAYNTLGDVTLMGWGSGPSGDVAGSGAPFFLIPRHKQLVIAESVSGDPTQDQTPALIRHTSSHLGPLVRIAKVRGSPLRLQMIDRLGLRIRFAQPGDKISLFLTADGAEHYHVGTLQGSPMIFDARGANLGAAAEWDIWLAWQTATTEPIRCPYITHIMLGEREQFDEWEALEHAFPLGMPADGKERA